MSAADPTMSRNRPDVPTFGWLGLDFTARQKIDWDEVRELIDASFRLIAPKKLIKQLDEV